MGLFDFKKKVREPEPPPGPPLSTSRPKNQLQKQQQQQTRLSQQQQDPGFPPQQQPPWIGSRSRGSVIQDERGPGGGGGGQQWDPPQRTAGQREPSYDNYRSSLASDREWTVVSPPTGFVQPTLSHPSSNVPPPQVPASSPRSQGGHSAAYYNVAPGTIFPSHTLPPPINAPANSAPPPARYATTENNHSHNGSHEELPYRSSLPPPQQISPPQSAGHHAPTRSYDGSHDSHGGMAGGRAEVVTPVSFREGGAGGKRGGDPESQERQGSEDSATPLRPPRSQPPSALASNPNPQQQPLSTSHQSISHLPSSPPPPPPLPPPPVGQHAKVGSFSSLNALQSNPPPSMVTQIYDSPSYPATLPPTRAPPQQHHPLPTATVDSSRYPTGPTPPPPPPLPASAQQNPHLRSQEWSAPVQQQTYSRLSQQPQPVSVNQPYSHPELGPASASPRLYQPQAYASVPDSLDAIPVSSHPVRDRYSQQLRPFHDHSSAPATPVSEGHWQPSVDQQGYQHHQPMGGKKDKGDKPEKKKFGIFPRSHRNEVDGDEESTKSSKKVLKKEAKERDLSSSEAGHGSIGAGNGVLPKGWKEEDVEDTISSLVHLPPHAFQSSSEHLAFTSQIDDLTHRLLNDAPNGTLAEKTARQLRKEIKELPRDVEKEGTGAAGSVAELWWKLMWTGDAKIMRLCSNQKFLSNLETSFKKLPAGSQQKIDIYHVFGVITETFRGTNGSEDLEKHFAKVYEHANEQGLTRSPPPHYIQALKDGTDRHRSRQDYDDGGRPQHTPSGFQANVPSVSDDLERMARECEGAWKTKEDLLQLLRDVRNDEGAMEDPEMRARIRDAYQSCFHIETELVNHRPWAESQAAESLLTAQPHDGTPPASIIAAPLQPGGGPHPDQQTPKSPGLGLFQTEFKDTRAQVVLRRLMEVTSEVSEALEAFHEWERELQEEEEMRIISERSRKETRHDRSKPIQTTNSHLTLPSSQAASASRSPSPIRAQLWDDTNTNHSSPLLPPVLLQPGVNLSSKSIPIPLPPPPSLHNGDFPSRSASPDVLLSPPPRGPNDPALLRSSSPVSRPLPVPEKTKGKGLMGMLGSGGGRGAGVPASNGQEPVPPASTELEGMSEKARGKMRVIDAYEADDAFDPDDIYKTGDQQARPASPSSIHSSDFDEELADDWVPPKPVTYVYDAALERKVLLEEERKREALRALKAKGRGSSYVEDEEEAKDRPSELAPSPLPSVAESHHSHASSGPGGKPVGGLEREKEMGRMLSGVGGVSAAKEEKEHNGNGLGRKMSFWKKSGRSASELGKGE